VTNETAQDEAKLAEPRLKARYREQVVPQLMERFGYRSGLAVPRLEKIVLNMGVGQAAQDAKYLDEAKEALRVISGQQPVVTLARKSVAGFHVRQGQPIGCKVTLRRRRMYEFLDRVISIVIPRIRDFHGLSVDSFDGTGNYTVGIEEHFVFPEADVDQFEHSMGLDVTICTTAGTDQEAFELLSRLGMPFRVRAERLTEENL